ncbi:MAG: hypothetical protein EZS28_000637 [Streblomastix strix]|uniref:Uncharacterized protein n=1 Tax=Streblomastix strix TaxID=222440 RepID=A0A5J4X9N8_9EUKA|nr:MAG: hypothetical protein EZS28_000637 [Streblomastix strix]
MVKQQIKGRLRYVNLFDYQYETQYLHPNIYPANSKVDAKLTIVVTTETTQTIAGTKTFLSNISASGFVKSGKGDISVLLAGGGNNGVVQNAIWTTSTSGLIDIRIMSSEFDEALLDKAGLHDFPELYAYIRERYQQTDADRSYTNWRLNIIVICEKK